MNEPNFDRALAVIDAQKKSAKADMKQHADKLIQGFDKLDNSHAKRAVWELVQNASDLSENCEVEIDFSNFGFSFSHNGTPFISETLISLIKQVSSKNPDKKEDVGQFGTGFITTHSFGKIINLKSILKEGSFYIDIDNFKIDRYAKNSDELVDKLVIQEKMVYHILREGRVLEFPEIKTTFTYITNYPPDKDNITYAESNLHHYIPIVLGLNDSLKAIKVISSNNVVTYYKKGKEDKIGDIVSIPVLINDFPSKIFCLRTEDKAIQVVLPISENLISKPKDDSVAKLFLFFPLIGTEDWGCNFVIHSKLFAPTEQRDGLHLMSKNEQTQLKEAENRRIIDKATEMIFAFTETSAEAISDPINLTHINFNTTSNSELTNTYYKELKQKWVNKFISLKLVETAVGRETPANTLFLSSKLLIDDEYYESIYSIVSMFWKNKIPNKGIAQKWTEIVNEWNDDSIHFITIELLVDKIQEQGNLLKFDQAILHSLYVYFIKYNDLKLFEDFKLLPNIKNEFVKKGELKLPSNIDKKYIEVADILIPEVPKRYIKSNFSLGLEYSKHNRKNISDDFNTKIYSISKDVSTTKCVDIEFRDGLIALCSIFPTATSQSTRKQIMPKICSFYGINFEEYIIPSIDEEKFDYDYTPFRGLIKIFLYDIVIKGSTNAGWVEQEIAFLKECLSILTQFKDLKDILESIPVFPNQKYILCNQVDLKIEKNFPLADVDKEFLKEIYSNNLQDIKKDLVLNEFTSFIFHTNEQTGLELAGKLELLFKTNGSYEEITKHPNKAVIFQIVQKLTSNKEWSTFFPNLEDKKAIVMMAKISDPNIKDDLFSIIGLEDKEKIGALGELSRNPNLKRIIQLGKAALEEEFKNDADLDFKKKIGVHIENLIREKIKKELHDFSIKILEEQGGQDIVVKMNNVVVYYIEVKSRWDNRNSIIMSNLQIKRAVKQKNNYSLCCVEMCDYYPEDGNSRYEVQDIDLIIERIKVVNDIGIRIEPLISNAMFAEISENNVKLTDEYRALVPQTVVNTGMDLETFVDHLIILLRLSN